MIMSSDTPAAKTGTRPTTVKIAQARGRPMLSWVGKRPLREVRTYPAQEVERFSVEGETSASVDWSEWPTRFDRGGLLFHGDNVELRTDPKYGGFFEHRPASARWTSNALPMVGRRWSFGTSCLSQSSNACAGRKACSVRRSKIGGRWSTA